MGSFGCVGAGANVGGRSHIPATELKQRSKSLSQGKSVRIHTRGGLRKVSPNARTVVTVYGPRDAAGGRAAETFSMSIQEAAQDCIKRSPCILDHIENNTIIIGKEYRPRYSLAPFAVAFAGWSSRELE